MIPDIIFILLGIALCILCCILICRLKYWACELEIIVNVLRKIFEDR